jgi:2-phospho-L-lactate guanylyltransferase
MRVAAVIPQKQLSLAKRRLASVLSPRARAALSLSLLRHVCAVLRAVPGVEEMVIMTPDPAVGCYAAAWGIRASTDPAADLNSALAAAISSAAGAGGLRGTLVLAADLPWLHPADATAMLRSGKPNALVIAPSKDGSGTNALLVPPGLRFQPAYGERSRTVHRQKARDAGLEIIEVHRPGLAFDLDMPDDLPTGWTAGIRPDSL